MSYPGRIGICALVSFGSHLLLARGTAHLPPRVEAAPPTVVRVALRQVAPEPEPEPQKPAEAKKEIAREVPARRARAAAEAPKPTKNLIPTERPDDSKNASDTPVFGISMESTSAAGTGPAIRVGNTLQTKPKQRVTDTDKLGSGGLAPPLPAYEVTKMPLPKGDCSGQYTDEAREAGLEGTVILSFVVDEHGRVRDIKILQGLGSGLGEAAKRAVQACVFSPGERDGKPVPTRIPSFKVRFSLRENE
jgi:TonB family protein